MFRRGRCQAWDSIEFADEDGRWRQMRRRRCICCVETGAVSNGMIAKIREGRGADSCSSSKPNWQQWLALFLMFQLLKIVNVRLARNRCQEHAIGAGSSFPTLCLCDRHRIRLTKSRATSSQTRLQLQAMSELWRHRRVKSAAAAAAQAAAAAAGSWSAVALAAFYSRPFESRVRSAGGEAAACADADGVARVAPRP